MHPNQARNLFCENQTQQDIIDMKNQIQKIDGKKTVAR